MRGMAPSCACVGGVGVVVSSVVVRQLMTEGLLSRLTAEVGTDGVMADVLMRFKQKNNNNNDIVIWHYVMSRLTASSSSRNVIEE